MGTDSVDEVIDDTTVLFADPNGSNKKERASNGATSNPGLALTHKLEKKLRTSKTPSSKTPPSKNPLVHNESEIDRAEPSDASKIALLHPSRLLIPAKTASDQPLIAYDLDSDEEIHFSRTSKPKCPISSKEATARLLANDFDIELRSDDEDGDALDLIRPQPVQPRCVCCRLTCNIM